MGEPVAQRARERSDDRVVLLAIACGQHDGIGMELKLSDPFFQYDLIRGRLMKFRHRGVEFVEKDQTGFVARASDPAGRKQLQRVRLPVREVNSAEFRRIFLGEPDIDQPPAHGPRELRRERGLPDSRRPQQQRRNPGLQRGAQQRKKLVVGVTDGDNRLGDFTALRHKNASSS